RQSRIAEFEERARHSFVDTVDVEVPMAEAVVLTPTSAASDTRRASRTYGSPSRNSSRMKPQHHQQQQQQHYVEELDYEAQRRHSINALAELTALEAALEESKVLSNDF